MAGVGLPWINSAAGSISSIESVRLPSWPSQITISRRARGPRAADGRIHFAGEDLARFDVAALPGQQLLVAVVHAAGALQVGHDQDARALCERQRAKQEKQ